MSGAHDSLTTVCKHMDNQNAIQHVVSAHLLHSVTIIIKCLQIAKEEKGGGGKKLAKLDRSFTPYSGNYPPPPKKKSQESSHHDCHRYDKHSEELVSRPGRTPAAAAAASSSSYPFSLTAVAPRKMIAS